MARVKGGVHAKKKHKSVLKRAKGYRGAASRRFKVAKEAVFHAERYAYRDRRRRKGNFRRLWITRINAAARMDGLSYSRFMHGLKLAEIDVDRKNLADLAVREPATFSAIVGLAKTALGVGEDADTSDADADAGDVGASPGVADATPAAGDGAGAAEADADGSDADEPAARTEDAADADSEGQDPGATPEVDDEAEAGDAEQ